MKRILIIGAASAIAEATARMLAARGDSLVLAGRNEERLEALAADLRIRGAASAGVYVVDANRFDQHAALIEAAAAQMGGLDAAIIAHGTLSDQKACEADPALMRQELSTNFLSVASLAALFANRFEQQRSGSIVVVSSVAGDRGRQSNYVYGAAKGATTVFLQGLRNRLHRSGVHVATIKPGFVDTPMTAGIKKGALWAQPADIAASIVKALDRRRDVVYAPWFWRPIMCLVKAVPEVLFKRLKL